MFLKQYNYKPRSGSQSSGTEASNNQQAAEPAAAAASNTNQQAGSPMSAAIAGRRRSSASTEKFAGLQGYKRNSQDGSRPDFTEQQGQAGVLGQMWNNFTKGK